MVDTIVAHLFTTGAKLGIRFFILTFWAFLSYCELFGNWLVE